MTDVSITLMRQIKLV